MYGMLVLIGGAVAALIGCGTPAVVRRFTLPVPHPARPGPRPTRPHSRAGVVVPAAVSGLAASALLWRWQAVPELAALAALVPVAVALACVDLACLRLPDALTLPSTAAVAALLGTAALLRGQPVPLGRALLGGACSCALHAVVAVLGGMGGGDAKLAALIGGCLAYRGWGVLVAGVVGAFVLAALVGAVVAATGGNRRTPIPFGPLILVAALAGLLI